MKFNLCPVLAFISIIVLVQPSESKNILVWGPLGMDSIRLSMTPFMEALAEKGHNVTYISLSEDKDQNTLSKINKFVPRKLQKMFGKSFEGEAFNFYNNRKTSYGIAKSWYDIRDLGILACQILFSDPEFIEWVKASPKYDVILVEELANECGYGFVAFWDSKLVAYSTNSIPPAYAEPYGIPDESSSITDITLGFPPGNEMSFLQRFVNALNPVVYSLTKEWFYFPVLEDITREGWKQLGKKGEEVPSFAQVERNTSLVLLTTHFCLDYPRSLPPNVVTMGGSVIVTEKKPLSQEVKTFLDSATNGFIYISFGTGADFRNFDKHVQLEFIKALGQFPSLKFLWKCGKLEMKVPENVLVVPWVPQQTVLAHPKLKAFITHAGMGSMTEAIHFSVPLICIPILAEQDMNANVLISRGAGVKLEIVGLRQEQLKEAISEVLQNEKYLLAMKRLTKAFKDRQIAPIDNAVFWIEYILRHENTNEFLLPPSTKQSWWKRRQIDVWLTVTFAVILIISISVWIVYKAVKLLLCSMLFPNQKIKTN